MKNRRVVLITGAAGGIGGEIAKRFLTNEDIVIATDRDASVLTKFDTRAIVGDITVERDCQSIAEYAAKINGHIDVLINCAGYFPVKKIEEMTSEEWRKVIDINLTGHFLMTKAALPFMKARGWGRIVNVGSASFYEGVPGQSHYVAAKGGLIGFTRSIARELGQYGITVNLVTPGLTSSETAKRTLDAELFATEKEKRSLKREEKPADLAGPTFFLASPDADFMTGQMINVDGGKSTY